MKYTRYDFKRKKSENTGAIVILLSVLLLAFFIGTLLSKAIMKTEVTVNTFPKPKSDIGTEITKPYETSKFIVIQGGKFVKTENLEQVKKALINYGNPFTINEQNGTRVLLGIYNENDSRSIINELNAKNIDNSKILFEFQINDLCNKEIQAIINAELEVINKLSDKSIKSIQTDELKNWSKGLQEVDSKSINFSILNDYKTHINTLPKELNINNAVDIEIYIYNLLKRTTKI